jgi:sugar lactone lactonase YvrE
MAYNCRAGHAHCTCWTRTCASAELLDGVTISNGLDWSDEGETLFYIDTHFCNTALRMIE